METFSPDRGWHKGKSETRMQVQETKNEGLSREFLVTIPAEDIGARVDRKLEEIKGQVNMPGFRPGKVPLSLLRKRYGKAVLGEVLEGAVNETTQSTLSERELKPAMQPKIEVVNFDEGKDLEFKIGVELMPDITPMDFAKLDLTRLIADVSETEVDEAVQRLARDFRQSEPVAEARPAAEGDVVVIDFEGAIDGTPFDGGKAEDFHLELGSGRFIPGFEEQLEGALPGQSMDVTVTFPQEYAAKELAGKDAVFAVTVKELRAYKDTAIDDELAKSVGLESLAQLKEQVRARIGQDYGGVARARLKRELLDKLFDAHSFDVPEGLVESEFDSIWEQYTQAKERGEIPAEEAEKDDVTLKAEYRDIARRRVLLGLLLSHVGEDAKIDVTQEELNRAAVEEARRHPGQEQAVLKYFQDNPQAMAALRAPILEEKVVDYIVAMAQVTEKRVSPEELLADPDEAGGEAEAKPAKKPAAKKTAAKKPAEKKPAAKKAPARKKDAQPDPSD